MAEQSSKIILSAEDRTKAAFDSVARSLGGLEQSFGAIDGIAGRLPVLGTALAAAFGAVSFTSVIKGAFDYAGQLNDLSLQTGATVEQLSALRNVAELSDTSLEQAGSALGKLAKNMNDAASGGKASAAVFEALAVTIKNSDGTLRDTGATLVDVAKSIAAIESPTERVAAAQLALGKSGAQLVPLLMDIAQYGLDAAKVTTEQALAADMLGDTLVQMKQQLRDAGEGFALDLLPAMAAVGDVAQGAMFAIGQLGRSLAVIANDIATSVQVIGAAIGGGFTSEGQDYIKQKLDERRRFIEAANDDLEQRAAKYQSLYQKVLNPSAGSTEKTDTGSRFTDRLKQLEEAEKRRNERTSRAAARGERTESAADIAAQMPDWIKTRQSDKWMDILKRQEEDAERLAQRYKDLADPLEKYRRQLEEIAALREYDKLSAEQQYAAEQNVLKSMADAAESLATVKDNGKDTFADLTAAVEGWGDAFTDTLADMAMSGKINFGDLANSIIRDLLRMQIQAQITRPLLEFGSSWLSGLFSGGKGILPYSGGIDAINGSDLGLPSLLNADGNVFAGGTGLSAYTNTIVSSPTLFKFANGGAFRTGLMGEAGPEAIMPLTRINGKLGVRAEGGGSIAVEVNVINQSGTPVSARQQGQARFDGDKWVVGVVLNDIRNGGPLRSAISGVNV